MSFLTRSAVPNITLAGSFYSFLVILLGKKLVGFSRAWVSGRNLIVGFLNEASAQGRILVHTQSTIIEKKTVLNLIRL
jgi:hypothetical protein